jgi:hypothetical protein
MSDIIAARKKPVEIQAVRFTISNGGPAAKWCGGRNMCIATPTSSTDAAVEWIDIPTLEGVMRANLGDYIIRGVQGEFYPCKPDIFDATYDVI